MSLLDWRTVDVIELLEEAIDQANIYDEVSVYKNYSGRGMYGKTCLGVVGSSDDLLKVVVAASRINPDLYDEHNMSELSQDNMGLDYIWYWRHIKEDDNDSDVG
jgi:hypothetical protein